MSLSIVPQFTAFRRELTKAAPQIISGEVSTNILKNDAHRQLPESMTTCEIHES